MKKITFALIIFCAFACSTPECIDLELGIETELKNGDLVCIDGAEYSFFGKDDRCPCGGNCIWEGEFRLNFQDSEGVNIYTYHQIDTLSNETPPFSESFSLVNLIGQADCGDPDKIDDVTFVVKID